MGCRDWPKSPAEGELVAAVQQLLRRGLPVTSASADPVLLDLRGVVARAVDPADEASRTAALNLTARRELAAADGLVSLTGWTPH